MDNANFKLHCKKFIMKRSFKFRKLKFAVSKQDRKSNKKGIMNKRKMLMFALIVVLFCGLAATLNGCKDTDDSKVLYTEGLEYEINSDDTCSMSGMGSASAAEDIVLPEKYEGKAVVSIGEKAFFNCTQIKSVTLPSSITKIDAEAFAGCINLKNIYLSDNLKEIDKNAFYQCESLESISFKDKLEKIGEHAFFNCKSFTNLEIPTSVNKIGINALMGCDNLSNLKLPFLGGNKDDISNAKLKYLFGSAGNNDDNAKPPKSLKNIEIMGGFIGEKAFYQCESIENVAIGSGIDNIGDYAFFECVNMQNITLPESIKIIGNNAFEQCQKLGNVSVPKNVNKIGNNAFKNCMGIKSLTLTNGVNEIGEFAFERCNNIAEIVIPDSVTKIAKGAFTNCNGIQSVVIGKGLTILENNVFGGCKSLKTLEIGAGVKEIKINAFRDCSSLKVLTIPESVNKIYDIAFQNCTSIEEINVDENNTTYRGKGNCIIQGNTLVLGCKTSVIPEGVEVIKDNAFANCEGLQNINIPSSVIEIQVQAFSGCTQLKSFNIDSANNIFVVENNCLIQIDNDNGNILLLAGNTEENERVIPNNVSIIGEYCFQNCRGITNVTIPISVNEIRDNAFVYCDSLIEIKYEGTKEQWENLSKYGSWCNFENPIIICCTDGKLDVFENDVE